MKLLVFSIIVLFTLLSVAVAADPFIDELQADTYDYLIDNAVVISPETTLRCDIPNEMQKLKYLYLKVKLWQDGRNYYLLSGDTDHHTAIGHRCFTQEFKNCMEEEYLNLRTRSTTHQPTDYPGQVRGFSIYVYRTNYYEGINDKSGDLHIVEATICGGNDP